MNRSAASLGRFALVSCLAGSASHCRQADVSSSQGVAAPAPLALLDQLQTGEHSCGISYDGRQALPQTTAPYNQAKFITTPDAATRNAVLGALAAVPPALTQLFFQVAGGRIEVGAAAAQCQDIYQTDEEKLLVPRRDQVASCWLAPKDGAPLRIVLKADPKLIATSLVKLFAFVQAEYVLPMIAQPKAPAPFDGAQWQAYIHGFQVTRDQLADAYLKDLKAQGSRMLAASLRHAKAEPDNFGNIVYANAVDSYFCSLRTRQTFVSSFPAAWATFTDSDNAFAPLVQLGSSGG